MSYDKKPSPYPLPMGEGQGVTTKCHLDRGEVVFEIKFNQFNLDKTPHANPIEWVDDSNL